MIRVGSFGRLVAGALFGAAYVPLLAWLVARRAAADTKVMGVEAAHVTRAIMERFPDHVASAEKLVASMAVLEGVGVGIFAALVLELRDLARERRSVPRALAPLWIAVPAVHFAHVTWIMAQRPALFAESFYERGGASRLWQVLVTDYLGPTGVLVACALLVAAATLGEPSRVRASWARLRARLSGYVPVALAASLAVGVAWAWPTPRAKPKRSSQPNVLVLAADSLRADRVTSRTMPALAALASRSVSFDRAYVTVPRTFPSWVTWLTGQWPHEHGVRNMFPSARVRTRDLRALPQRLSDAGYFTAVASDYAGDVFPRIALGFSRVDTPTFHFGELIRQKAIESQPPVLPMFASRVGRWLVPSTRAIARLPDADDVAERTLSAVDASGDRPFFVVAFFGDAHFPYATRNRDRTRFTDRGYRGRYKYEKQNRLGREAPPDDADIAQIRGLYDGATRAVDDGIAHVLDGLAARGLDRSTIVVVTADHGEALFEDGRGQGHGDHLFGEQVLRVPLVVHDGRAADRQATVSDVVRDVDLAPTIAELCGLDTKSGFSGASLVPALQGRLVGVRDAFSETGLWFTEEIDGVPRDLRLMYPDVSRMLEVERERGDDVVLGERWLPLTTMAKHRALTTATHRLIVAPTREGPRLMLYDLVTDPACVHDLSATQPQIVDAMKTRLYAWITSDPDMTMSGGHFVHRGRGDVASTAVRLPLP